MYLSFFVFFLFKMVKYGEKWIKKIKLRCGMLFLICIMCIYFNFNSSIFCIILIWRHANSYKVAQSRVKSVYFRTTWAVMASPVKSFYFRTFLQNFPPSHAKSLAVMVSRAKSAEFHGQRGGYIHTHNSVTIRLNNKIFLELII